MRSRPFGNPERMASVIGQGTWKIEGAPRASAVAALRRGIDLGMTHLDTAEMYGSGVAEQILGEAVAGRRHEVLLVSKVLPSNASRQGTMEACERSLARLGTDYLDCYLLHWRGRYPLAETIGAFMQLRDQGKIRSWGMSNFDVADLEEAAAVAGAGEIACNQVLYHVRERAIEHAVIPWCEAHCVTVVAYSPFGSGNFPESASKDGRVLEQIAASRGASARQIALAWLTRRPSLLTIPKASTIRHAEENAAAGEITLEPAEIARIDAVFPLGRRPRSLPML
jgi:diketogulonate reductase-like aldo/keto reductase